MTCKYIQPKEVLYGFELPNASMLTAGQVAAVLDCTENHVYNLCGALALESINIAPTGKKALLRIPRDVLKAFIEDRTTGPLGEVDFSATDAPHGLTLPEGRLLRCKQVAGFLRCTEEHIYHLIDGWELTATNISKDETRSKAHRIPRAGLIHFINSRTEGAC